MPPSPQQTLGPCRQTRSTTRAARAAVSTAPSTPARRQLGGHATLLTPPPSATQKRLTRLRSPGLQTNRLQVPEEQTKEKDKDFGVENISTKALQRTIAQVSRASMIRTATSSDRVSLDVGSHDRGYTMPNNLG